MEYFTTGQFAKLANVSERTLRYYDKIGLLKPSKIKKNGYRNYSKDDLFRLQKIILLKKLGFPLEEITIMLVENDEGWVDTLRMQVNLVDQKIRYFSSLKETLKKAIEIVADEGMSLKKNGRLIKSFIKR
ncbi:MerR family transcriptional regulator [uncultured Dubosiella sp.]|uniref:MerR family transcriptional regulator n=1 Tax=uncultured Dubosiella sp. TaxID=1937011 RepID=UPI0025B35447|nr:MerR family transcriptional regulator [uncultured Dubosiella sp.]